MENNSQLHLLIQYALQNLFAEEKPILECRFREIDRVADLVLPKRKLIFEIQCSPITPIELVSRNRDYRKAGYSVIWVLHDRNFNRSILTPAEKYLIHSLHYFTNLNIWGEGMVYKQTAKIKNGKRMYRGTPQPLTLQNFEKALQQGKKSPLKVLKKIYRIVFHSILEKFTA